MPERHGLRPNGAKNRQISQGEHGNHRMTDESASDCPLVQYPG